MLVVSRKQNESIRIEPAEGVDLSITLREVFARGPILVTLTQVGMRRVRLLIDAPTALKIWRGDASFTVDRPLPQTLTLPDLAQAAQDAAEGD